MTSSQQPNVLVVDDNEANCKLVAELLRLQQIMPTIANNGDQAINLCKSLNFDLVLLDLNMPGRSGIDSISGIRASDTQRRTPIVALTAEDVEDIKLELLQADLDDFLSKPLSENDLNHTIHRWISSSKVQSKAHNQSISGTFALTEKPLNLKSQGDEQNTTLAVFSLSESLKLSKQMPDLALDMFNLLLGSLTDTKQQLASELARGDYDELYNVAHKFLGGCCYCGVPKLRARAKTLDRALSSSETDPMAIKSFTLELIEEIKALQAWVDEVDVDTLFEE